MARWFLMAPSSAVSRPAMRMRSLVSGTVGLFWLEMKRSKMIFLNKVWFSGSLQKGLFSSHVLFVWSRFLWRHIWLGFWEPCWIWVIFSTLWHCFGDVLPFTEMEGFSVLKDLSVGAGQVRHFQQRVGHLIIKLQRKAINFWNMDVKDALFVRHWLNGGGSAKPEPLNSADVWDNLRTNLQKDFVHLIFFCFWGFWVGVMMSLQLAWEVVLETQLLWNCETFLNHGTMK